MLVSNKTGKKTYLADSLTGRSVCGKKPPGYGWLPVEHNDDTVARLSPGSRSAYDKLPVQWFIVLGDPVTVKVDEKTDQGRKTGRIASKTIDRGAKLPVIWRKNGLTSALFGSIIIGIGRNQKHKFVSEVNFG